MELICHRVEGGWVQNGRNVLAGGLEVTLNPERLR
jgi:hypothetical protein